ncbi:MAG: hypothetical protein PHQ65_14290 [Bacteroidales bacterium]|nr:hypothetical protein [Bacteroidales bacterium]MDD3666431.1 hypothetical protein [Bacteroidales bacterium]
MVRKKVFTIIGIILFALAGVAGWFGYQYLTRPALPPLQAVPLNAVALLRVSGPALLWEKLSGENQVWASLRKISTFSRISSIIKKADSVLVSDPDLHRVFEDKELIISLNPLNDTTADFLFILQMPVPFSPISVNKFINRFGTSLEVQGSDNLRQVSFQGASAPVFYYISNGLFVGSYSQKIVEASWAQLSSKQSLANDDAFAEVSRTAGKNVDANLFIQFSRLPGFLRSLSTRALVPGFEKLKNFARWSGLDLVVHSNQLLLSGYTRPLGSDFLRLFRHQQPGVVTSLEMLPSATAYLAAFRFDDFNAFADSYNNYLSSSKSVDSPDLLRASTVQNLKDADLSEIVVAQVNAGFASVPENSLVVVKSRNADQLTRMLNQTIPSSLQKKVLSINGREVRAIRFADFFGRFLQNVMPDFDQVYYFRLDDYFIFCPSADHIHQMLISYLTGQTLANDPAYQRFAEEMSVESSIYLYYNTSRSIAFHHYLFDDSTAVVWDRSSEGLKEIEGVGLQFSGADELCFTHIAVKQRSHDSIQAAPEPAVDTLNGALADSGQWRQMADSLAGAIDSAAKNYQASWEVVLPGKVIRQPYKVNGHRLPGKQGVVVFSEPNAMSLINETGGLLWTIQLPEVPLGGVHSVDFFKNGKIQYLFNSPNFLFLVDANGHMVKPFPVKLPERALAAASVVELKGGDFRIYVPGENHVVHAFKPNGTPDPVWKKPRMNHPVSGSLRHLRERNTDYLVIPEANGNVVITNLKGEQLMTNRGSFTNNTHSTFYINETNNKGVFLTTDQQGNLTYVQAGGKVEKTVFDRFSKDHLFVYGDLNRDGSNDFIYIDGPQLVVYDRFKNVLLQYRFRRSVTDIPELFTAGNQSLLGVFSQKTSEIYLFSKEGLFRSIPYEGSTPFIVLKQGSLPVPTLVTAGANRVWGYRIGKE